MPVAPWPTPATIATQKPPPTAVAEAAYAIAASKFYLKSTAVVRNSTLRVLRA